MRSIIRLLLANLRHRKGSFTGIVVLMAIVTLSYAITVSNNRNLEQVVNSSFAEQRVGDWVFLLSESPSAEAMQALRSHSEITDIHEMPYLSTEEPVLIDGEEYTDLESLRCVQAYDRMIEQDAVTDPVQLKPGEICLSYRLSRQEECAPGKEIRIPTRNGYDEIFTVKGFYQEVRDNTVKYGLLCKEDFDRIYSENRDELLDPHRVLFGMTALHVSVQAGTDLYALKQTLRSECTLFDDALNVLTKEELRSQVLIYTSTGSRLLAVYIVLLVVIVLIVMGHSISNAVETEYTNLGILKALGFDRFRLRTVWIMQYTLALLLGSLLGILLSVPATAFFGRLFTRLSNILTSNRTAFGRCALTALLVYAVCLIFVIIAAAKVGRISPVQAITGGHSAVYFDSRLQTRIRKRGLSFFIALRQLTSRTGSYFGSMLIVALLVFFLSTVMIFAGGISTDLFMVPTGDVEITMYSAGSDPAPGIREICRRFDPDAELQLWTGRYMYADDEKILLDVYNDESLFVSPLEGRLPQYSNEVTVTELFAEKVRKDIGDTVTVRCGGREAEYVITGLIQSVKNPAGVLEITAEGGKRIGIDVPDVGYVKLSDPAQKAALTDALNAELSDILSAKTFEPGTYMQDLLDTIDLIVKSVLIAVYSVSVVFAAVVVLMICRRTFLRERTDIGIYRALGFPVPLLRRQFALRFLLVAAAGSVCGCLCSALCSGRLLSLLMRFIGISRFGTDYTARIFLMPALAVSISFFAVAYIASRSVRAVSVRELVTE